MKILIRLFKGIVFIPLILLVPFEALFFGLRWIVTGQEFGNPVFSKIIKL